METPNEFHHRRVKEVGGPARLALVIAVSFMPDFTLQDQEGRLLTAAFTKNFQWASPPSWRLRLIRPSGFIYAHARVSVPSQVG